MDSILVVPGSEKSRFFVELIRQEELAACPRMCRLNIVDFFSH